MTFPSIAAVQTRACTERLICCIASSMDGLPLSAVELLCKSLGWGLIIVPCLLQHPVLLKTQNCCSVKEQKPVHKTRSDLTRSGIWPCKTIPMFPMTTLNWVFCGDGAVMSLWCGAPLVSKTTLRTWQHSQHFLPTATRRAEVPQG